MLLHNFAQAYLSDYLEIICYYITVAQAYQFGYLSVDILLLVAQVYMFYYLELIYY